MMQRLKISWILMLTGLVFWVSCTNDTDELYRQAQAEAELGSAVRAIELLNRVEQQTPTFTDAYLLAGKLFRENGNYEAAIDQYKRGLMAGADTVDITLEIGQVYLKQQNFAEAYKFFNQTLARDGKNVDALIGMAQVLYNQKLYAQAQKNYQQALTEQPKNYAAMNGVAYAYMAQKNVGGALEMFQKAIDSNPVAGDAYVGKALALAKTDDVPLAQVQEAFEQAREMDPKNQDAAKTFIEFINKPAFDLDYRINQTKAYLVDFPDDFEAWRILGALYIQKSRSDGNIWLNAAETTYKRILSSNPEDSDSHASLAAIYLLENKPQLAVLRAKMAFEIDPTAKYASLVKQAEAAADKKK